MGKRYKHFKMDNDMGALQTFQDAHTFQDRKMIRGWQSDFPPCWQKVSVPPSARFSTLFVCQN